ncbi:uridine kinase [Candidatus Roizmanbacteria bacterium RIFOXYC2_FULL_38_9]|nr:MAG: uridine kinase [Candidatus Roizmanbacteria bacterium RIFOXYC2_FULL_38_9]
MIIGITGGTSSGKSTVTQKIRDHFKHEVIFIAHDNYYKDQSHLTLEQRAKVNYDHPNSLDTKLLVKHLKKLLAGTSIEMPQYDFTISNRKKETVLLTPKKVIIIEGILIFENEDLRNLMDIKIFVDTDADLRLGRKITRDIQERGRTLEHALNQYVTMSRPMHLAFVEPNKKYADIIIPQGGNNRIGVQMIIHTIEQLYKESKRKI